MRNVAVNLFGISSNLEIAFHSVKFKKKKSSGKQWLFVVPFSIPNEYWPSGFLSITNTCYRVHEGLLNFLTLSHLISMLNSRVPTTSHPTSHSLIMLQFRQCYSSVCFSHTFLSSSLISPSLFSLLGKSNLLAIFSVLLSWSALDTSGYL